MTSSHTGHVVVLIPEGPSSPARGEFTGEPVGMSKKVRKWKNTAQKPPLTTYQRGRVTSHAQLQTFHDGRPIEFNYHWQKQHQANLLLHFPCTRIHQSTPQYPAVSTKYHSTG